MSDAAVLRFCDDGCMMRPRSLNFCLWNSRCACLTGWITEIIVVIRVIDGARVTTLFSHARGEECSDGHVREIPYR